jgi:hypothetical protein
VTSLISSMRRSSVLYFIRFPTTCLPLFYTSTNRTSRPLYRIPAAEAKHDRYTYYKYGIMTGLYCGGHCDTSSNVYYDRFGILCAIFNHSTRIILHKAHVPKFEWYADSFSFYFAKKPNQVHENLEALRQYPTD